MIPRKSLRNASALYSLLLLPLVSCHMEMSWPYPLRSKYNPANSYNIIDYSMTSPLEADGSNFPCKGYQNDRPIQTTVTYSAGSTYNMTLEGSATHGGGSCQLSLSYDNGATFRVIKSMIGGCPLTSTYDFTVPSYAPAGSALLAWTWQNLEGNREFYMNCAEVSIVSGMSRRKKRQTYSSMDQLPYMWKANLDGVNDCTTTEGESPHYPNPGPDVEYGAGMSSSDPPTPGDCDSPIPYGQTYRDLGDSIQRIASASSPTTFSSAIPSSSLPAESAPSSSQASSSEGQPSASSQYYSTSTVTVDCPETVTMTIYPSASGTATVTVRPMPTGYTTSAPASVCTGTSASCPCANGYQCQELSPCTWACNASPTSMASPSTHADSYVATTISSSQAENSPASSYSARSTVVVTTTGTVVPVRPSSSPTGTTGHPPYANGGVERYLPCVPGTFICTSNDTWDTCNYNDGSDPDASSTSWIYGYPRNVSAGMECITFLSPYSDETSQYAQQALTPDGSYRDDRIVRARPDGDCDDDGSIKCTDGGQMFEVCDQGGWVDMGPVANGTTCSDGQIVASS